MNFWWVLPLFALAQASCYDYEYYDPQTGASMGDACNKGTAAPAAVGQPQMAFAAQPTTQFAQPMATTTQFAQPMATTTQFAQPMATTTQFATAPSFSQTTFSQPQTTSFSSPAFASAPSFPSTTSLASAPIYGTTFTSAAVPYSTSVTSTAAVIRPPVAVASAPVYGTPVYSAPATTTTVYGSTAARLPVTTVAQQVTYGAPTVAVPTAVVARAAPQAVVVNARATATTPARSAAASDLTAELEYYKELGERQQRQHRQNARTVKEAQEDLSRSSLFNRIIAGNGEAAPWYPAVRLDAQKDVVDAYKSEKRIANKNAEDAYQRYQKDPTRLNLLVSKYQDLNADLRDAAYHYNVVNTATFGQRIAKTTGLFGSIGGGLLGSFTQILTQKQQSEDLQDIQRQMQRIERQIAEEARAAVAQRTGAQASPAQGSVQQRMMAMNVYGPQRG